ncbi:glycine/D-amino acid oxidase-like deaminating enzyme [Gelidibacter algens]|uniref:Glycine/D-amino acid oxidase-like deaminating enzyme n=1 Tax=Gelidibacter algens TaxID=49280 RepID=A0A1A7R2A0_9FLAO|nr:FAD-binding oxidoreductase [Gelidibacter algens]OBX24907.1 FAD-dependent oxidoreductase [Gelidibacter algens]RAJ27577.1 glycine/D-amino acid oxidase-like deaminating enzyme [Gelidibacter algens]
MRLTSVEPFWLVKNGIINSYPSLTKDIDTDIVIVGAGITGSLIAHQCMADGYKTVIIDKREVCHGSTSATTSMLQYEIDKPLFELIDMIGEEGAVLSYKACFDSIDQLQSISKGIKSTCGFKKKKSLYFASRKKDVPWLKKEFEAREKHGFPVKWLEAETIKKTYQLENSYGGILSDQGGSIDAFQLAHDLLHYNHKKGLQVFDKTDVVKIEYRSKDVLIYTEFEKTIKANKIIFCNGFESTEIIPEKIVNLLSTYAVVGEQNEDDQSHLQNTLFWNTADPYNYMRTTDDNRLLMGGEDEDFVNADKRDGLLKKKALKLKKTVEKLLPKYDFRVDFGWAGTFGETNDGLPYIGKHPDFKNAFFVLGFGGNGITFSVIGMDMVSKMLKGNVHELSKYFKFGR